MTIKSTFRIKFTSILDDVEDIYPNDTNDDNPHDFEPMDDQTDD